MEADKLYLLIGNTSLLTRETLPELKQVVEEYPYFHTARMLYLKNLAVLSDEAFGAELKKTAIHVPDRRMLYTFIEEIRISIDANPKIPKEEKEDTFGIIDDFLKERGDMGGEVLVFIPSASSDYIGWKTVKDPEAEDESSAPPMKHQDEIDKYLDEDKVRGAVRWPVIGPETEVDTAAIDEKFGGFVPAGDSYFTETLARIYIKQKRYAKALEIIQKLSLQYPGKSVYFADQIRFLKKLIINTKK